MLLGAIDVVFTRVGCLWNGWRGKRGRMVVGERLALSILDEMAV